jgi:hypothetical protein
MQSVLLKRKQKLKLEYCSLLNILLKDVSITEVGVADLDQDDGSKNLESKNIDSSCIIIISNP